VKRRNLVPLYGLALALQMASAGAYGQAMTGFQNPYYTTGTRIAPSTLVPTLRKWYLPQRLYSLYAWRPEEYTNYARELYQTYNPVALEGAPYYDQYGAYITRGWEIYNWTESYPESYGSNIFKDPRFSSWFRNLVIASSHAGEYHTALMAGDGIRTSLTPLTFSKPRFDGVQWDFLSDKYAVTLLGSRANHTGDVANNSGDPPISTDPFTNLYAMRTEAQVGDFARVGFTFVNAAHRSTNLSFGENSLKGVLAGPLNTDFVRTISVRIADDSPEDGIGGALLSRWRIFVNGVEHTDDIQPTIEGGLRQRGVYEASGADVVTLTFNLEQFRPSVEDQIDDFRQIESVEIGLVLANDYAVSITSNKQTNMLGTPVYLPVLRAAGNVKDGSNQTYHQFRYGLPTGNRLMGFSLDVADVAGFSLRGEAVRNYQYRRFPNENIETGQALATTTADAYYLTAQKMAYPWNLFGEIFRIDHDYSTRAFIPTSNGEVFYDNESQCVYEFVDDNDDQDELADWTRKYQGPVTNTRFGRNLRTDDAVFPGLDEDNDDISDFNRNFNQTPDYAEPFLRFEVDPPAFLFGMDMNNNTVIDRFEDDTEADYPYQRGRSGYNFYGGVEIFPGSDLIAGRFSTRQLRTNRHALGHYLLWTMRKEFPERDLDLWFILHPRKVQDNIPDDVLVWTQEEGSTGGSTLVRDPLVGEDAFVNTAYFELRYDRFLPLVAKVKHEIYHQYQDDPTRRDQEFLGIITKGEYPLQVRGWKLQPRWKQQYASQVPCLREQFRTQELTEILSFMVSRRLTQNILVTAGGEYEIFENVRRKPDPVPSGWAEDSNTRTIAAQVSNVSPYSGYGITTNVGFQWSRVKVHGGSAASELFSFITVYAGLGTDR